MKGKSIFSLSALFAAILVAAVIAAPKGSLAENQETGMEEKVRSMAHEHQVTAQDHKGTKAMAKIQGLDDNGIEGSVVFVETQNGVQVTARIFNAPPGKHGFHVHEFGSCDDAGKAAGGHYNPLGVEHGYLPDKGMQHAHAGDMGNIEIAENGSGELTLHLPGLSVDGTHGIAGRGVILHEKPDDFGQPTGNAGGRIACGTIAIVAE